MATWFISAGLGLNSERTPGYRLVREDGPWALTTMPGSFAESAGGLIPR